MDGASRGPSRTGGNHRQTLGRQDLEILAVRWGARRAIDSSVYSIWGDFSLMQFERD